LNAEAEKAAKLKDQAAKEEADRLQKQQDEERILKIETEIEELGILIDAKGVKGKDELKRKRDDLRKELKKLKNKYVKGGTLANKKKHIHKITKRGKKIKNKLTKRYKKIKKSKRTRKLVS
jgi:hypothetical protein